MILIWFELLLPLLVSRLVSHSTCPEFLSKTYIIIIIISSTTTTTTVIEYASVILFSITSSANFTCHMPKYVAVEPHNVTKRTYF